MAAKELTIVLVQERETKNTVRFAEKENLEGPPVVGTLYIQKYALRRLGNPTEIVLTIKAKGDAVGNVANDFNG